MRGDHRFSDSDSVFFRWNEQYISTFNPDGDLGARTPKATNRNYGGGWIHSFSPNVILEVRGGVATQPTEDAPLGHPLGNEPLKQLGFAQIDRFEGVGAQLSNNPWSNAVIGVQGARPRGNPNWNISSDLTWLRGSHNFKTGFQFIHIRRDQRNQFESHKFPTQSGKGSTGQRLLAGFFFVPWSLSPFALDSGFLRRD